MKKEEETGARIQKPVGTNGTVSRDRIREPKAERSGVSECNQKANSRPPREEEGRSAFPLAPERTDDCDAAPREATRPT